MAEGHSFSDYIKRKCYNGLFSAAEDYIRENVSDLGLKTHRVHRIDMIELQDITIQRVYISDLPGMKLAFDVGLELEVVIKEDDYHYDETDINYPWIRISCVGDLSKALDDWKIVHIEPFDRKEASCNSLSDGMKATSNRYLPMKSISEMHFFKRLIPSVFLKRKELRITDRCQSIMWKAVTKQSSIKRCS